MTTALTTAQWLVLARFALMLLEMALVRAHLVRGRYTLKDTLASVSMRAGHAASPREAPHASSIDAASAAVPEMCASSHSHRSFAEPGHGLVPARSGFITRP